MTTPQFAGPEYLPLFDRARLAKQFDRVVTAASTGEWKTLRELSAETGAPQASVSAQLRHAKAAGMALEKRRRGSFTSGLYEYRLFAVDPSARRPRPNYRERCGELEEALTRILNLFGPCHCDGPGCAVCHGLRTLGGGR